VQTCALPISLDEWAVSRSHRAAAASARRAHAGVLRDDGSPRVPARGGAPPRQRARRGDALRAGGGALPRAARDAQPHLRCVTLPRPPHSGTVDASGARRRALAARRLMFESLKQTIQDLLGGRIAPADRRAVIAEM